MAKAFVAMYLKSIKPLNKKCPLDGEIVIDFKFESNKNFISMLPQGNYQFGKKVFSDEDKNIFSVSFLMKVY